MVIALSHLGVILDSLTSESSYDFSFTLTLNVDMIEKAKDRKESITPKWAAKRSLTQHATF